MVFWTILTAPRRIHHRGKTVDEVFISQPASTFAATDAKQFYVSVSRGKEAVSIYTDDKEALLEYASEMGDRQSASELVGNRSNHMDHVQQQQKEQYQRTSSKQPEKPKVKTPSRNRDYEPGL